MSDPTYQIVTRLNGEQGILCRDCGLVSWNPNDVAHKYCGRCHAFHYDGPLLPSTHETRWVVQWGLSAEEQGDPHAE